MSRRVLLALGSVAAGAVGPAGAAASWSSPLAVGEPFKALSSEAPVTVSGESGLPLTVVAVGVEAPDGSIQDAIRLLPQTGRSRLLGGVLLADPVGYGRNRVALLRERALRDGRRRLEVVLGDTSGATGRPHELTTRTDRAVGMGLALAASPRGAVAAAWLDCPSSFRCDRGGAYNLRVARRAPGGKFRRPVTVASGDSGAETGELKVAMAFGRNGELLVAHTQPGKRRVQARTLRRDSMSAAQTLGRHENRTGLRAAAAGNGRLVVAWATQELFDDGMLLWFGPLRIRAATRSVGARAFGQTQLIDNGDAREQVSDPVRLGVARDGTATLAWTQQTENPEALLPVRVVTASPRGRFGRPEQLSSSGGLSDLVVASDGTALALWRCAGPASSAGLAAAFRGPAARTFETAEAVTGEPVALATAFLDPTSTQPFAFWTSSPPTTQETVAVRQAAREAETSEVRPACPRRNDPR